MSLSGLRSSRPISTQRVTANRDGLAVRSALFLVVRLWDAFADLLAGRLVDRTMTRWGKFRPFIMFGAMPLLFMSYLVFQVPASFDRLHRRQRH